MRPNDRFYPLRGTPKCFCGLPASPAYSEEFGLLYECHYLHNNPWNEITEEPSMVSETVNGRESPDSDQSDNSVASSSMPRSLSSSARQIDKPIKAICGYHIHKDAWDSFFDSEYLNARHQELAICPFFNFTFCAFFHLRNSYSLSHPPPPTCFCGLPVVMRHVNSRGAEFGKLMFTCPNYLIDGARPKCTWKLWASEVPFQRSNGCTHPLQMQGATRLLDPSRQIQNFKVKRGPFNNHNSFSRGRNNNGYNNNGYNNNGYNNNGYNNNGYNNNNGERFKNHQRPSYRRDSSYHSSERFDRNNRREHDFNHNYQYQQPTFSSSVSRRISNGTGSSYSQKGWDPGRNWNKNQYNMKGRPRWDNNNGSSGSYHEDNSDGRTTNKNTNSTNQQSRESNIPLNEINADKTTKLKPENEKSKECKAKDLNNNISCNNQVKDNINSNDIGNQELKPLEKVNNSNREQTISKDRDKSVKNGIEKESSQTSPDSYPRSDCSEENYNEGIGSSLSNGTDSSRLSMGTLTYNGFSQTKPACVATGTSNVNFVTETSRLLTENQKLISENQSLISKQENDQSVKSNLVMQVEQLKDEVKHLLGRVGHYKSEYVSEQKFRQSSQKKLIELQAQVADVMKEIDELRSLKKKEKEESVMENMKCRVCFEETITHALLPCYHLALCGKCSQIITKCVICRKQKESVVRIYLG